jgi:phytoene dehydrogenase-like protein
MLCPAMSPENYDVIIIGAGMSGLAAGIRLAYYDKKVCILDKHYMPGGLNSFYRLEGRDFDVGLHAMTNYVARDVRGAPLNKLLRQLRIKYDEFALCPQRESDIRFPGKMLRFSNDYALFESEVCEKFPAQGDRFRKLVEHIVSYNDVDLDAKPISAREVLNEYLCDDLLIEMLFCPLMYYGSANVDDMEFGQFVIMFKSIFREGFARPRAGVRQIISTLLKKYKACGGELRMGSGVSKLHIGDGRVKTVELDDGKQLSAPIVLSSAGAVETMTLCSDLNEMQRAELQRGAGRMTFVESISVLNTQPEKIGFTQTITFFNNAAKFRYRPSEDMVDPSSAVICCPNNFQYDSPLEEGIVRLTNIANFDAWAHLPDDQYQARKREWYQRCVAEAVKFVPDFRPHVTFVDTFTPRTIWKFTRHVNGAVYGAPEKLKNGRTRIANLFLCGTDQGFLGIVGALLSGISMANLHVLQGGPASG